MVFYLIINDWMFIEHLYIFIELFIHALYSIFKVFAFFLLICHNSLHIKGIDIFVIMLQIFFFVFHS